MMLRQIYLAHPRGSEAFVRAVLKNGAFDLSPTEVQRIAHVSTSAEEFEKVYLLHVAWYRDGHVPRKQRAADRTPVALFK